MRIASGFGADKPHAWLVDSICRFTERSVGLLVVDRRVFSTIHGPRLMGMGEQTPKGRVAHKNEAASAAAAAVVAGE